MHLDEKRAKASTAWVHSHTHPQWAMKQAYMTSPFETVRVSERITSAHQITSLSKHEAFNRCETPGSGCFHTTESQLTKNEREAEVGAAK